MGMPFSSVWVAALAGVLGAIAALRAEATWTPVLMTSNPGPQMFHPPPRSVLIACGIGGLCMAAAAIYFIPTNDARPLWATTLALAIFSLVVTPRDHVATAAQYDRPQQGPGLVPFCLLVVLICGLYVLILRPDADDAFYLNLPIGMVFSQGGMLTTDTMYGIDAWPVLGTNYKIEALPTLIAAIAWATGLPVVIVSHFVLPMIWCVVLAATLAVIGYGMFGRNWWVFAVLSVLASMIFAGTLQSWGVHGLTRLFHGKGPLILIVVPLIVFTVWRSDMFDVRPGRVIPMLAGLSCAALGLTANAVYIAPLALGLALGAGWVARSGREPRRLLVLSAALPVLAAGLWLLLFDKPVSVQVDGNLPPHEGLALWDMVAGKPNLLLLLLVAVIAAAAACFLRGGRWISAFVVMTLLFVINPWVWPAYDRFVTGGLNFRLWWAIPVPMMLAAFLTWGVVASGWTRAGVAIVCAALLLATMTPFGLIGTRDTSILPSMVKLPVNEQKVAAHVLAIATHEHPVLAAEPVAALLPGFEGSPPLVYSRRLYLDQSTPVVAPEQLRPRRILSNWVNGDEDADAIAVIEAMQTLCVDLVILSPPQTASAQMQVLNDISAASVAQIAGYHIYKIDLNCV
ncbi:hypothetical protein RA28_10650 [Ruegeria sp. ANG-S4]|nr:hypothetical protein RA28_10650 [Ruegeria sp. ANG-S4]